MNLLVFGKTGQVARELARIAPDALFLSRDEVDLTDPEACARAIEQHPVDAIINAAAYTAVDNAETDIETAMLVNGAAPESMAMAAAKKGVPLVHISTDYVFNGQGNKPWCPADPAAPLGVYGRSKLAGENGVRAAAGRHVILRTSWVISAHGSNFVKSMLRLAASHDSLRIVADQKGGPTPAEAIAQTVLCIARKLVQGDGRSGTYHYSGNPDVSWADLARAIFQEAGKPVDIEDIATAKYPTPAKRPLNSRLDCSTLKSDFAIEKPDWRDSLARMIEEIRSQNP